MNSIRNIFGLLIGMASLLMLPSCADEWNIRSDWENDDDFTGVTIFIPNVQGAAEYGASRADDYINPIALDTSREAAFNTLYIVAVDENGGIHTSLKTQAEGIVEQNYNRYRLSLAPGKYKFYVVANMNRYLFDNGKSTTLYDKVKSEDDIKKLILNFTTDIPLQPGFLPMACLSDAIKVGPNKSEAKTVDQDTDHTYFEDGYVKVASPSNTYIYADLKYLCSKVTYTILFNKEKSSFADDDIIDVHRSSHQNHPFATNIRQYTSVVKGYDPNAGLSDEDQDKKIDFEGFITHGNNVPSDWAIELDRYNYGDFDFYGDGKSGSDILEALKEMRPWTSADGSWTTGDFLKKRAWKGVTYLPENLLDGKPTLLNFPYSFNGQDGAQSPRTIKLTWDNETDGDGIKRGMAYQVYVLITTPDPEQWSVEVIPQDWTLQNLMYELHGPYELIVETTKVPKISMQEDAEFWFKTDLDPEEIIFESPQVSSSGTSYEDMVDIFTGYLVRDDKGKPKTNADGAYIYHVSLNNDVPYGVMDKLNKGFDYVDKDGQTTKFTKKDISYFHLVAGSLHKRIDIVDLNLDPYLEVTPQTILIDTREQFTSGHDEWEFPITFETNVDISKEKDVTLTVSDPSGLLSGGVGDGVLLVANPAGYKEISEGLYDISDKEGEFVLQIFKIVEGSPFWNLTNEYTLTFTLTAKGSDGQVRVETKTVTIKVRPFAGNYTIHFRDNTKPWAVPHIWVYQLLTLPADLTDKEPYTEGYDPDQRHPYAGRIVGYIEDNPTQGLQWNGAAQYVFSNNCSFKGWHTYGGPDFNNPWASYSCTDFDPEVDGNDRNKNKSTMGFVMFGQPEGSGQWNYDYSYLAEGGRKRYNYDVNFNADHENVGFSRWSCQTCKDMSPDYNGGNNDRFYTGIAMEKETGENEGWYRYTLSGVAQPGRTLIVFANWHEPWMEPERDYRAEDYRWPGDYETGVALFDFEDNEGWLLFDGNTTNSNQKFVDDKPVDKEIAHYFNSTITSSMRIGVKKAAGKNITGVTANNVAGTENNALSTDDIVYYDFTNVGATGETMNVVVKYDSTSKTYKVGPKFFNRSGSTYVSAQPLFLEFGEGIDLFVKWNDYVELDDGWGGNYAYYKPKTNGNNDYLSVRWTNKDGSAMVTKKRDDKVYGNYKYLKIECQDTDPGFTGAKDKVSLNLCNNAEGTGSKYHQNLKVEDLPGFYNPSEKYYQINWHMFGKPND